MGMRVLVSGSSGLVGTAFCEALKSRGGEVLRLVRRSPDKEKGEYLWNPATKECDLSGIGALDGVVHLAGKSVADHRWNDKNKKELRDSRILGSEILVEELLKLEDKPKVLVSASAVGIYGNRGDEVLEEESSKGDDFLSVLCKDWEAATQKAKEGGIRVANARIGLVLSKSGGALKKMLLPFKLGLGGRLGSGKQWMSWVTLDDLVRVLFYALETESLEGPFNAVAPNPRTNLQFTKDLGAVLGRPTIFPVPGFMLRLIFGEIADWLLLVSQRVDAKALRESGFKFETENLQDAFRKVLSK